MYADLVLSASTLHCPSAKYLSEHKPTLDNEDGHYNIEVCSGAVVKHQAKKPGLKKCETRKYRKMQT